MSDNPLEMTPEREHRIRERAYVLWEEDGRPEGRAVEFWERAAEQIAIEDHPGAGLLPNPMSEGGEPGGGEPGAEPVEEASIQDNLGEFPERSTDQGDHRHSPMTRTEERREIAADRRGGAKTAQR
jgi:hypothetical protein